MGSKSSRREFIDTCGRVLLAGAVTSFLPLRQLSALIQTGNASRTVDVMYPSDNAFAARIDSLFPGLLQDPAFQTVLPSAILVTNTSGPPIKALSVTWSLAADGKVEKRNRFLYLRSGPRMLLTCDRNFLRPGQTRLVTPFLTLKPKPYQKGKLPNWSRGLRKDSFRRAFAEALPVATITGTAVDAIVYADWMIAGSDPYDLAGHLTVKRNAEHDEAVSLLHAAGPNPTHKTVTRRLKRHRKGKGFGVTGLKADPRKRLYYRARKHEAKVLLKHFKKSKDPVAFVQEAKKVRSRKRITIKSQPSQGAV